MSDPMTPEVRDWMKRTDVEPPDARQSARQVMDRLPEVRQRRRWWPVPVFYRKPEAPTTENRTSTPASNGHTPTVIGRTSSMLSPVKAITAGAIVFAIGGVVLVAQPYQQKGNVPGAEAEAVAPTWVTGTVQPAPSCSSGDLDIDGDVRRSRNVECSPQAWTASDPRLTGAVSRQWNEDTYQTDEGTITVSMDLATLRNDEGGWACSASDLVRGTGSTTTEMTATTYTCIGDGGYDGLSAHIISEQPSGSYSEEFMGLIFSGEFPSLPEPPADE